MSVRAGLTTHAVLTLSSAIEEQLEEERARVNKRGGGGRKLPLPPLRLQLHNLTGTLCVAVEYLGTKKTAIKKKTKQKKKKKGLILHPTRSETNLSFFYSGNCTKNYKKKKHD